MGVEKETNALGIAMVLQAVKTQERESVQVFWQRLFRLQQLLSFSSALSIVRDGRLVNEY
ncbi:hypothetical protein WN944_009661 [Citrus x changshan-huyou]|uniref:Uncharacterized protein n=1 Tax=Citrus x changshan-huyou TaxID=2935761 RepID=A0AAP0MQ79_9ROSI